MAPEAQSLAPAPIQVTGPIRPPAKISMHVFTDVPVTALAAVAWAVLPEPSPSVCVALTPRYCPVSLHRRATRRRCLVDVCAGPVWGAGPGHLPGCARDAAVRVGWDGGCRRAEPGVHLQQGRHPLLVHVGHRDRHPDGVGGTVRIRRGYTHGVVGLGFLVQRTFGRPTGLSVRQCRRTPHPSLPGDRSVCRRLGPWCLTRAPMFIPAPVFSGTGRVA